MAKKSVMGRPKKEIPFEELSKLCTIHCTIEEICGFFEISVDTLERAIRKEYKTTFAEYYAEKAAMGKASLRRMQWQLALKGDRRMLVWLGKQHLDQIDMKKLDYDGPPPNIIANAVNVQVVLTLPDNGRVVLPKPDIPVNTLPVPERFKKKA